jgi:pilus assembly protein CpaC
MNKSLHYSLIVSVIVAMATFVSSGQVASAQATFAGQRFQVDDSVDQLEIIAGSARRLKFNYDIPEIMVENPEVIQATPVSPNEILISGLKPGVSTFTVSDPDKNVQMISVEVKVDTRKLEMAFRNYFPDSQIKVHPLQTGVILAGHVARADQVANIMSVARDFFPTNVVNQLQVNGNQNIAIKVKVYEVSRTKLRQLGIDWSYLGEEFSLVSSVSQIIQAFNTTSGPQVGANTLAFGVVDGQNQFNAFINTLERHTVAKLLDQPVLVAQNGRPAEFLSGGEIPIQIAVGLGTNAIEFRAFGTKLDMVPIVHGNGELTLEVRAEVSEIAEDLASSNGVPGFRVRRVNTGVKMKAGHTLALAGDYREDHNASKTGVPGLMNNPVFGPLFRNVVDNRNETELVFLITPRFISDVDPSTLPALGPGQMTAPPSNEEFYRNGYLEVPRCNEDCPINDPRSAAVQMNQLGANGNPMSSGYPGVAPQQHLQPQSGNFNQGPMSDPYPQPTVASKKSLKSLIPNFMKSSRRDTPAEPRQANNGFLWPSNNQTR